MGGLNYDVTSATFNLTFSPEKYGTQLVTSVTSLIFSKESERDLVIVVTSVTNVTCVTSVTSLIFSKRVKEKEREEHERERRKRKMNEKEDRERGKKRTKEKEE